MPAITITDLNNAKSDVDHIAALATSTALTATDRMGNVKKTMAGVNADINVAANGILAGSVASAAAALASLNDFKGRYYGVLSADPALDPLGAAVTAGDLYFNSTSNVMKVYAAGGWLNYEASAVAAAAAATTGAGTATTQAGIATTQAALATTNGAAQVTLAANQAALATTNGAAQVVLAANQVTLATTAKTAAEAARDAANAVGKVFTSTALGIAGTTNGQSFSVLSADLATLIIYSNSAGVANELLRYYTKAYTDTAYDSSYTLLSGYLWGVVDDSNRIAIAINAAGEVVIPEIGSVASAVMALKANVDVENYDAASGYLWGVVDKLNRIAIGLNANGDFVIPAVGSFPADYGPASGYLWGVADASNKIAFGINNAGNLVSQGVELKNPQALFSVATYITSKNVVCWGDSLTQGNTAGVTAPFPVALQALLPDRVVTNKGTSGQTSTQIACKSGAKAALVTATNNTIPASGPVSVTFDYGNLSSKSNFGNLNYSGTLFGIAGTLTVPFSGTPSFTRTTAGVAIKIPNKCPFLPVKSGYDFETAVIWSGYNNKEDAATVISDIALMVADLKALDKCFVVLSVINARYDGIGTAGYDQTIVINDALLKTYPYNIIDIRKILVNAGTDPTELASDIYPVGLTADGLHLNDAGYKLVANTVFSFLQSKGW